MMRRWANDRLPSEFAGTAQRSGEARAYRYDWQLFADWCQAAKLRALPTDPVTIALFLDENPAATNAHRIRLTAINSVHQRADYPAPGTDPRSAIGSAGAPDLAPTCAIKHAK
jgi:hypothetical protein